jgi:hypothetical protein
MKALPMLPRRRTAVPTMLLLVACSEGPRGSAGTAPTTQPTTAEDGGTADGESGITTDTGASATLGESSTVVDTTGEMNCGEEDFQLEAVPPNVVLVLDKSGSMLIEWDADADPFTPDITRWNSLYSVVDFVVVNFDNDINFGANLFPAADATNTLGAGACGVENVPEVPVAANNALPVLMGIPPADTMDIHGATPATAGIEAALAHLVTLDPDVGRFMILVTDGAANCGSEADTSMCPGIGCGLMEEYDARLAQVVGDALTQDGVPTFVVGIDILDELLGVGDDGQPEANTFEELNLVAISGGKPRPGDEKFFNAQNEAELMDALSEIAGQVVSCIVPLESEPTHPDFVDVEIGGNTIGRVQDCATEDGWTWVNPDGPYDAIELCGTACELLADIGNVDITFGCPPPG